MKWICVVIAIICFFAFLQYAVKGKKAEDAEQIEVIEEAAMEEESQPEEQTSVPHEESIQEIQTEQENIYAIVTEKSQAEVEEYARQVKELFMDHDWDKLAEMISYPIEINGTVYAAPSDIVQLDLENKYSEMFMSALEQESCHAMYCDSSGICLGSGEVWIAEVEKDRSKELKIVSINRLIKREDEKNLLVKKRKQETDSDEVFLTKYIYDNQERLWKTVEYNSAGEVDTIYEKIYDADGKLIKEIFYDSAEEISLVDENSYDAKGKLIKQVRFNAEGENIITTEYNYDEDGNLIKEIFYDCEGKIKAIDENNYDSEGRLIESKHYVKDTGIYGFGSESAEIMIVLNSAEVFYDESGRKIKEIYHLLGHVYGQTEGIKEYKYDKEGNLREQTENTGNVVQKYEYAYNKQNQVVESTYYYNGNIKSSEEYVYEH